MYIYQNLTREYIDNLGGILQKVRILPYNALEYNGNESFYTEQYTEKDLIITDTTFADSDSWLNFGAIPDTCSFESGPINVNNITMIGSTFKAKLPKVTLKGVQVMNSLVLSRCLLIIQDRNGNQRVLGRKDEPASFRFKEITGSSPLELNHFEITVSLVSSRSPAFLP